MGPQEIFRLHGSGVEEGLSGVSWLLQRQSGMRFGESGNEKRRVLALFCFLLSFTGISGLENKVVKETQKQTVPCIAASTSLLSLV